MSISASEYRREVRRDAVLAYELTDPGPLPPRALAWLETHGKHYQAETLAHFRLAEALLITFRCANRRRRSLGSDWVITIPAGDVTRCYRYEQPNKADRWRVVPSGLPAQWIGVLSGPDVLLVEGEWDCMAAFDHGFTHAATHTGGAGTWLPGWTPLFAHKTVWICYDRDPMGMKGAARVARALWPVAASVRLVDLPLPGTPEAKDVADYFRAGGTADGFRRLLEGARHYHGTHTRRH